MKVKTALAIVSLAGAMMHSPVSAMAAGTKNVFSLGGVASVTYGPYLRLELGRTQTSLNDAYWLSPGYPSDPMVTFDLGSQDGTIGALALGYDWMNGFRGDISLISGAKTDLSGVGSASTGGTHASITGGTVRTTALMANVFYSPLEQAGVNTRFQPFLVAGLGLADNNVSPWTRTSASSSRATRTFSGNSSISLAVSLGLGLSWQITRPGQYPVIVEAAYRYYQFGTAEGGSTPLAGNGSSTPVQPLTFKPSDRVISLSIRVPLKRL